jgi:hypothetical protein
MELINEINKEFIYKICRACNEAKTLNNYGYVNRVCKQCNRKKQAANQAKCNKTYYLKNQDKLKKQTLDNYCKRKECNNMLLAETIQYNMI